MGDMADLSLDNDDWERDVFDECQNCGNETDGRSLCLECWIESQRSTAQEDFL